MSVTLAELCAATVSATAGAIYSPTDKSGQVDEARFTNNSSSAVTLTLWRVASGASPNDGNLVLYPLSLTAQVTTRVPLSGLVIADGSQLYARASTDGVVTAVLSGREQA